MRLYKKPQTSDLFGMNVDNTVIALQLGTAHYSVGEKAYVERTQMGWSVKDGVARNRKMIKFPEYKGNPQKVTMVRLWLGDCMIATVKLATPLHISPLIEASFPPRSLRISFE